MRLSLFKAASSVVSLGKTSQNPRNFFFLTSKFTTSTAAATAAPMFKHQASLPKLPVPDLHETCALYLKSVRPLLNDAQYDATTKAVAEFVKPGGMGHELQKRLKQRDAAVSTSWLIDWWNDYAYMAYRDPVIIYVSYFYVFRDDKFRRLPAARAASLIRGAMQFRNLVLKEQLEPDMSRTTPLCMHQYKFMFNTTRVPTIPSDVTKIVKDPSTTNHVIVVRKNKFYSFDAKPGGKHLSTADLEAQLRKIYFKAGSDKDATPIGLLTTEHRDTWTKLRGELLTTSARNKKSIEMIDSAVLVVCLDDTSPITRVDSSRACWHGDGQNRWFDKACQLIVFDNGKAGFNGEHSMMDATPTSRMCEYIVEGLDKGTIEHGSPVPAASLEEPVALEFDVSDNIKNALVKAQANFDKLISAHEVQVVVYEGYGKELIKKLRVSPDAYAQMAIQLAYYKMKGECVATYESAQTKKYAYGRTETCRSVSVESVAWVKAMEDPYVPLKVKGELGRKAIAAQSAYMAKAVEGKGVDRHLLGLRLLLTPDEKKPAIFTDPAYASSCHWRLSTSQITSEYYDGYGWGEVVPDGWGCAYMVKDNSLQFNLASLKLGADTFRHYFHEALNEMKLAFEASIPDPQVKAKL